MLTATQKKEIAAKVEACFVKCESHFGREFLRPNTKYTLKGTTAGTAHPGKWELNFHPTLATQNWDDYLKTIVPHEVAHLIDYEVYRKNDIGKTLSVRTDDRFANFLRTGRKPRRQKRSLHGPSWKRVMGILGVEAARCHQYDTSEVARRKSQHAYNCTCGRVWQLGPKYHKNIQTGAKSYRCTTCKTPITASMFGSANPPSPPKSKATRAVRAPAAGSKLDGAITIVRANANKDRGIVITKIMNELGMSYAGAQTYYYKARQMVNR